MTAYELDREWLVMDEHFTDPGMELLYLRVGGWFAGLTAEVRSLDGWKRDHRENPYLDGVVRAQITDHDNPAVVHGRFIIPLNVGFHKGGVMLPKPVPDMNAACPYVLRFIDTPPALRVVKLSYQLSSKEQMEFRDKVMWIEERA